MASPPYNPFDGDPGASPPVAPYRPSVNDFGGAAFVNSAKKPPIPGQQPSCDDFNTMSKALTSAAFMVPALMLELHYSGVTPSVYAFKCTKSGLLLTDFTVVENSAGSITIAWPAGTLPSKVLAPYAVQVDGTITEWLVVSTTHTGLPAVTVTNAAGTRVGFMVIIDGE